jgi:hypothetical protein
MTKYNNMPDTIMAHAFLAALLALAQRKTCDKRVALPSGNVDYNELRQVICALLRARAERSA